MDTPGSSQIGVCGTMQFSCSDIVDLVGQWLTIIQLWVNSVGISAVSVKRCTDIGRRIYMNQTNCEPGCVPRQALASNMI